MTESSPSSKEQRPVRAFFLKELRDEKTGICTYAKESVDATLIAKERRSREIIQKAFSPVLAKAIESFILPIAADVSPEEDPKKKEKLRRELQSRVLEVHQIGHFDGFFNSQQIMVPPVDPNALVLLTQTLGIFGPLIDTMVNNVDGFGWMFEETVQLDNSEDQEMIREHLEGDLIERLETDGILRIVKRFINHDPTKKEMQPFLKSTNRYRQGGEIDAGIVAFVEEALQAIPVMKSEAFDGAAASLAIRAWRGSVLYKSIEDERERFEKIREREFRSEIKRMKKEKRDEFNKLKSFFNNCNPKESFKKIRKKLRKDYESVGGWSMEVVRDPNSRLPVELNHVSVVSVRLTKLDEAIISRMPVRVSDIDIVETDRMVKFRRYAQHVGGNQKFVWFKEFGDDRILDSKTGKFVGRYIWNRSSEKYDRLFFDKDANPTISAEAYLKAHPKFEEANELIYFSLYNASGSPYPLPRWFGALNLIQGLIAMEEVNASIFDNNMVPPYFILVAGSRLNSQSRQAIENTLEEKKRGRDKWNGVIILEAETQARQRMFAHTGTPAIEIKSMQADRPTDATHNVYDEGGQEKMRSLWRFPAAHVGKEKNTNRNTVSASKILAEEQIFCPERDDFDDTVDKTIMVALRANYWRYKSKGPPVADNKEMSEVLETLSKAGLAPVGELRPEVEQILGRQLPKRDKEISDKPLPLVLIEAKTKAAQRSDPSRENPEDVFGGVRTDKEGISSGSTVLKMNLEGCSKELGLPVGELHCVDDEAVLIQRVQELLKGHNIVAARFDDGRHILFVRGPSGGIGQIFQKGIS